MDISVNLNKDNKVAVQEALAKLQTKLKKDGTLDIYRSKLEFTSKSTRRKTKAIQNGRRYRKYFK